MPPPPQPVAASAPPVRVIVEVRPAAGPSYGASIRQAQDAVIASLPAGRATVVQRYAALPLLTLQIDPALLDTLRQNAAVVRVAPDEERRTLTE